jgi:Phage tail tube protein
MSLGIGAGGILGFALEGSGTPGTYAAPTKFTPIKNETLKFEQATIWRRTIRAVADIIGAVPGNSQIKGDVELEAFEDVCPYFHYCSRATVTKTGGGPNYSYAFIPSSAATPPNRTMSITVVRNGVVYAYVGCSVTDFSYIVDNTGVLMAKFTIVGLDEAVQSLPAATWPTTVPFAAGQYSIQIPTSTQVFDTDKLDLTCNDVGEAQFRLQNVSRAARFVKFGERTLKLSCTRDFTSRAEYDAFKALTAQSITIVASKGANNQVTFVIPVAVKDTHEVNLSGQAELLMAKIDYTANIDSTGNLYTITWQSQENIT